MNKIKKTILAILGGTDAVISIILPILVALLWIRVSAWNGWSAYVLVIAGMLASIFRAIKIGWMK